MNEHVSSGHSKSTSSSPEVSIIMPVHNSADFLAEAVNSILCQSNADWEMICVDDGSTDESLPLLRELAARDSRITVIHQENAGVSEARNRGIRAARGSWLMMLDSDDVVGPRILEELLAAAKSADDIDLVCCGFDEQVPGQGEARNRGALLSGRQDSGYITFDLAAEYLHAACWAKLFRRKLIERQHIFFETHLSISEDHSFVLRYLMHARNTFILQRVHYHYLFREQGAISRFDAGALPFRTYVSAITVYADLSRQICREWPARQRKAFCTALLAHYLRLYRWVLGVFGATGCGSRTSLRCRAGLRLLPLLCRCGLVGSLRMLRRHWQL